MIAKKSEPTTFQLKGDERIKVLELRHMRELELETTCSIAKIIREAINEKYTREVGKSTEKQ